MESDALRIVLLISGVVLIGGVFVWGWWRSRAERNARLRALRPRARRVENESGTAPETFDSDGLDGELSGLNEMISERRSESGTGTEPIAASRGDVVVEEVAQPVEEKIVVLSVVAHAGQTFQGPDILQAAQDIDLEYGDIGIFHRRDVAGSAQSDLFSMVNMVEPGIFDIDQMDRFATPGLTLFMRLPGPRDGLAMFSDMLCSAERLAANLDGELRDQTHSALSRQTIEHIKEEIMDHGRRLRLMH